LPNLLAPGVHRIATGRGTNAFLVDGDDGMTLVDVGWGSAPAAIDAALTELRRSLRDIRRIVITHAHPDHVRGLARIRELTGAAVLIHGADADWLRLGHVPAGGRSARLPAAMDRLPVTQWTPVDPDVLLGDGDEVTAGLRVIHTPGHSAGHIALLHEPSRTVLVGDALFFRFGRMSMGPAGGSQDPAARPHGLGRLPTDVAAVGFSHNDPLVGGRTEVYQQYIETVGVR